MGTVMTVWTSFLLVSLIGAAILAAGWWLVRREAPPRGLLWLALGAVLLRLAAAVIWYITLPNYGYDSPPERYGYVMADAYERDRTAWELASSEKPLIKALGGDYRKVDQYGGLLYLSAAVYRYTGSPRHQPLLMVVLTAAFSSLSVLFIWAFARRLWGDAVARLAAWGLAFYPEAVLIGSSQMREAFIVTLVMAACYGLLAFGQEKRWGGLALAAGALAACLPLSPPAAALLLGVLGLQYLGMGWEAIRLGFREQRWMLPARVGLVVVVLAGLWLALRQFAPDSVTTPVGVITWWVRKSADWQAHLSERASGWVQKIFDSTPEWSHLPLLLVYGVVQPFLPAALFDITGATIWQAIAIWRSIGWTLLLPFLLYAPLRALRKASPGARLERALILATWLVILVAAFRGGGDAWDNPRYRMAFAGLQVALGAWVLVEQRRQPDPWLRRVLVGAGLVLLWFVPWYLRRYIHLNWPVADLSITLGLGLASAALYWIGDWARGEKKKRAPVLAK
jgi:hypothetical protein